MKEDILGFFSRSGLLNRMAAAGKNPG